MSDYLTYEIVYDPTIPDLTYKPQKKIRIPIERQEESKEEEPIIIQEQPQDEQTEIPTTVEDQSYLDLSFEDLAKQENLPIYITSSFRKGSTTKQGRTSNHSRRDSNGNPLAYDIQPYFNGKIDKSLEGFNKLLNIMYSNPRVVNWMRHNNKGLLEEFTPEVMRRTGATGPHLHLGPDTWAKNMSVKRFQSISGLMLDNYYG